MKAYLKYYKPFILLVTSIFILTLIPPTAGYCLKDIYRSENPLPEKLKKTQQEEIIKAGKLMDYLERSGILYYDDELEDYLNDIGGRMVPPSYADAERVKISFRVVRDPTINAYALANGRIHVNTGLLARIRDEAQLAFILGHEISHVINRDMTYWIDSYYEKTIVTKLLDLAISPAAAFFGLYGISQLGLGLIYGVTVTGYGRDLEARCDLESIRLMKENDYNSQGAIEIFNIFIAENDKYSKGMEIYFLSSHPANIKRRNDIQKLLDKDYSGAFGERTNQEKFNNKASGVKIENCSLNIQFDRPQHTIDDLERIIKDNPHNEKAYFCMAEACRAIAKDPDLLKHELSYKAWADIRPKDKEAEKKQTAEWMGKARDYYNTALKQNPDYADPYRGLALLDIGEGKKGEALVSFEKYLEMLPDARDKRFVKNWIKKINREKQEELEKKERENEKE